MEQCQRPPRCNLQCEFHEAAEQGFHTLMANVMHATELLGNLQDLTAQQSVRLLQHVVLWLDRKNPMSSLT